MARWPINAWMHVMAAIAISSDCISVGIVVELIAISTDCASMDVDGGFNGGFDGVFDGGFDGRFHLAVLGYWPQQSVWQLRQEAFMAISRVGLTGSLLNELAVLQTCFNGYQPRGRKGSLTAISREGVRAIIIVTQPSYREVGVRFFKG